MDLMEDFCFIRDLICLCSACFDVLLSCRELGGSRQGEIWCVFILFHNKTVRMINFTMKNMFIYSRNMASSDLIFKRFHDIRTRLVKVSLCHCFKIEKSWCGKTVFERKFTGRPEKESKAHLNFKQLLKVETWFELTNLTLNWQFWTVDYSTFNKSFKLQCNHSQLLAFEKKLFGKSDNTSQLVRLKFLKLYWTFLQYQRSKIKDHLRFFQTFNLFQKKALKAFAVGTQQTNEFSSFLINWLKLNSFLHCSLKSSRLLTLFLELKHFSKLIKLH